MKELPLSLSSSSRQIVFNKFPLLRSRLKPIYWRVGIFCMLCLIFILRIVWSETSGGNLFSPRQIAVKASAGKNVNNLSSTELAWTGSSPLQLISLYVNMCWKSTLMFNESIYAFMLWNPPVWNAHDLELTRVEIKSKSKFDYLMCGKFVTQGNVFLDLNLCRGWFAF